MLEWSQGLFDWVNVVSIDLIREGIAVVLDTWLVATTILAMIRIFGVSFSTFKPIRHGLQTPFSSELVWAVSDQQRIGAHAIRCFDANLPEQSGTVAKLSEPSVEVMDEAGLEQPEVITQTNESTVPLIEETEELTPVPSDESSESPTVTELDMNDPYFAREPIDADAYLAAVAEHRVPGAERTWVNVLLTGYVVFVLLGGGFLAYMYYFSETGLPFGPFVREGIVLKAAPSAVGSRLYFWDYAQVSLQADPSSVRGNFNFAVVLSKVYEQEYTMECLRISKGKPSLIQWTTQTARSGRSAKAGENSHVLLGEPVLLNRATAGWTGRPKNRSSLSGKERIAVNNMAARTHFVEARFGSGLKLYGDEWTNNDPMFTHTDWLVQEKTSSTYVFRGLTVYEGRDCALIEQRVSFTGDWKGLAEGLPGATVQVSFKGLNKIVYDLTNHYIIEEQLNGMIEAEVVFKDGPYAGSSVRMNGPFYYTSVAGVTQFRTIKTPSFAQYSEQYSSGTVITGSTTDESVEEDVYPSEGEVDGLDAGQEGVAVAVVKTESGSNLRLRDAPSERAGVIGRVPSGTHVQVIRAHEAEEPVQGELGLWYLINYENTTGWVWGKYLFLPE